MYRGWERREYIIAKQTPLGPGLGPDRNNLADIQVGMRSKAGSYSLRAGEMSLFDKHPDPLAGS